MVLTGRNIEEAAAKSIWQQFSPSPQRERNDWRGISPRRGRPLHRWRTKQSGGLLSTIDTGSIVTTKVLKVCTFILTYLEQCIKYSGKEWISLSDDSEDGSEKLLANFPKDLVLEGHLRMRQKLTVISEYNIQKKNVLKASLTIIRTASSCAEDVDIKDLCNQIKAANVDREKGWNSHEVIQVNSV